MLKALFRRTFAAFGLAALLATPSGARAPAPAAHPALWAVSDADTTIYLFGTIHLLPANYQWRTPRFDEAVANSQQLVVETIVDLQKPDGIMAAKLNLGFSRGLPPIAQRVPPGKVPLLRTVIAKSGAPEKYYDQMETWLAAFELLGVRFREIGLQGEAGPEQTLQRDFAAARKPIDELETNAEQLAYFDKLPESAQRLLLEGAIEEPKSMDSDFGKMLTSWSRGDVKAISVSFNRDLSVSPALKEALLERRNANWSRWVGRRMATPGSVMIAVGAGHLAGPDSLVTMLKREGYKVRRIQ